MSKQQLYADIVGFLQQSISSGEVTGDEQESLEVAIDCIRETFHVPESTPASSKLLETYEKGISGSSNSSSTPASGTSAHQVSEEDKAEAQKLKAQGNAHMAKREFPQAIDSYTEAISKDETNPIFFANRAAAYAHLSQHDRAANDARKATELDPKYSKAWSRLGVALWALGDIEGSLDAYENGLKAEGDNPSEAMKRDYANVKKRFDEEKAKQDLAKQKSQDDAIDNFNENLPKSQPQSSGAKSAGAGAGAGAGGGFDFSQLSSMMQNPQIQQMAKNLMSDPSALSNLMNSPMAQQMKERFGSGGGMPNMDEINDLLGGKK